MNHAKKALSARNNKKAQKEIRTPPAVNEQTTKDESAEWKILSKFPKKIAKKEEEQLASMSKSMHVKKEKNLSKHSKRSTPGDVLTDSPFPHLHPENSKAVHNLQLQNQARTRVFNKKLSKSKG